LLGEKSLLVALLLLCKPSLLLFEFPLSILLSSLLSKQCCLLSLLKHPLLLLVLSILTVKLALPEFRYLIGLL